MSPFRCHTNRSPSHRHSPDSHEALPAREVSILSTPWRLSFQHLTLISFLKTWQPHSSERRAQHCCSPWAPQRLERAPEQFIFAPAFGFLISLSQNSSYLVDIVTRTRCVQPHHSSHGYVGGVTAVPARNPLQTTEAIQCFWKAFSSLAGMSHSSGVFANCSVALIVEFCLLGMTFLLVLHPACLLLL